MNVDTQNIRKNRYNAELAVGYMADALEDLGSAQTVTPAAAEAAGNTILATSNFVAVAANTTDVNDFVVLPSLADVAVGHTVTVVGNAAGFEVRTPASSNEKINNQDADGTKEYAVASGTGVHRFTKISDSVGWMGQGVTALGAAITAVVPD
jgi:hypothetical protein